MIFMDIKYNLETDAIEVGKDLDWKKEKSYERYKMATGLSATDLETGKETILYVRWQKEREELIKKANTPGYFGNSKPSWN